MQSYLLHKFPMKVDGQKTRTKWNPTQWIKREPESDVFISHENDIYFCFLKTMIFDASVGKMSRLELNAYQTFLFVLDSTCQW